MVMSIYIYICIHICIESEKDKCARVLQSVRIALMVFRALLPRVECTIVDDSHATQESTAERRKPSVQDLLDFASSIDPILNAEKPTSPKNTPPIPTPPRGSFGDLIEAARTETQNDDANKCLYIGDNITYHLYN